MEKGGILRYATVCLICAVLISYGFFNTISGNASANSTENIFEAEFNFAEQENKNEEKEKTPSAEKSETSSVNSSLTASASAVKGKVIDRYISPYSASLSYSNTYVKNNTPLNVDIKSLLVAELKYKVEKNGEAQVLIMHTHTTESFMESESDYFGEDFKSRNTDNQKNMSKIGDIVAEKLNSAGIVTIHDSTQHDYPEYTGSYSRAAKTVNSYLKKYPSIKIVLDLHRDAVSVGEKDKAKLTTEINGKKAAQVMLVMGSQSGTVTNHPNWQENLKLALRIQQTMEVKYPTLARPLLLMSKSYNQPLCSGSVLIEFGTDVNTFKEACYSAELVADSLVSLFNTLG